MQLVTAVPHRAEAADVELAALRRLLGLRVGGLLVSTGVVRARDLEPFLGSVPVVSVVRVEDHPGIYGVSYDEDTNGAILVDQVAAAGHQSVAVLVTGPAVSTAKPPGAVHGRAPGGPRHPRCPGSGGHLWGNRRRE